LHRFGGAVKSPQQSLVLWGLQAKTIMKTTNCQNKVLGLSRIVPAHAFGVVVFLFFLCATQAQLLPPAGGGGGTKYTPLNSWSFTDTNGWTSDGGTPPVSPVSFTNVSGLFFGDGNSLIVDSTNPAWVQYNVIETNGATTNLALDVGSIYFWFAPAWTSADQGGNGPGVYARLIEVGCYSSDGSAGWWSLLTDNGGTNLYFTVQPGDGSTTTYLQAPISWTSNYWHCITLTYCSTNTILYLDGAAATNGPGITAWPGTNVTAGGFFIGSDGGGTGLLQAQGAFDDLYTYNVPLDSNAAYYMYEDFYPDYYLTPNNWFFVANIVSAPSNPSTNLVTPDVITGQGNLILTNLTEDYVYGTNANQVWITNVTASIASDGTMNAAFTIEGGTNGCYYDVFVGTAITSPLSKGNWSWQGQGQRRQRCGLSELPEGTVFIVLGTPQDTDGDGLTDAYELLVSHTDPHNPNSNLDGILDGWDVLLGLNPQISNVNTPSERANYGYTLADWLYTITGVQGKSGTITTDNEGNVQTVSQ
jgi:hypothetical protein